MNTRPSFRFYQGQNKSRPIIQIASTGSIRTREEIRLSIPVTSGASRYVGGRIAQTPLHPCPLKITPAAVQKGTKSRLSHTDVVLRTWVLAGAVVV